MLIVENGLGLPTADSYISLADARVYAESFGHVLPDDDTECEIALRKGVRYVDNSECSFSGERLLTTQSLSFPRANAYRCYGDNQITIHSDTIPTEIKSAQVIAAATYGAGVNVRANDDGSNIASKEVTGAVKVSYHDNGKTGKSIEITEAIDALSPLLCGGSLFTLRTERS